MDFTFEISFTGKILKIIKVIISPYWTRIGKGYSISKKYRRTKLFKIWR